MTVTGFLQLYKGSYQIYADLHAKQHKVPEPRFGCAFTSTMGRDCGVTQEENEQPFL